MPFNETVKLELPESFPNEAYDAFMVAARRVLLRVKGPAWVEFAGAANLIAWRYRNCCEQLGDYMESWEQLGGDVGFEELYSRERNLFGAFISGVSCIEATSYAAYALASHEDVLGIKFGRWEQGHSEPWRLRNVLVSNSKASALVSALSALVDSDAWNTWVELRNRMTHRSALPRIIRGTIGGPPPPAMKPLEFAGTSSTSPTDGELDSLKALLRFLGSSLASILEGARELAENTQR
jgi:hypothetical protein